MDSFQELQDQASQQNAPSVQRSRSDLQSTGSTGQSSTVNPSPSAESLTQDNLSAPSLRVGDTNTTVANTTTTNPPLTTGPASDNTWLWLVLPLLVAVIVFWLFYRRQKQPVAPTEIISPLQPVILKTKKLKKKSKKNQKNRQTIGGQKP